MKMSVQTAGIARMSAPHEFVSVCNGRPELPLKPDTGSKRTVPGRFFHMPRRSTKRRRLSAAVMLALVAGAVAAATLSGTGGPAATEPAGAADGCVPVGRWRLADADGGRDAPLDQILTRAIGARVVLLGESHDSAEHHRWQLQVLAALHARHPQTW